MITLHSLSWHNEQPVMVCPLTSSPLTSKERSVFSNTHRPRFRKHVNTTGSCSPGLGVEEFIAVVYFNSIIVMTHVCESTDEMYSSSVTDGTWLQLTVFLG